MWSDSESNFDYLNFSEVAESVAEIINSPELLPISIGIFGDWGAGKSTILKLTEAELNKQQKEYIHIKFDAWLYQGYDDARASILETIALALIKEVEADEGLLKKANCFYKRVNKIRALGAVMDVGAAALGTPTGGGLSKLLSLFSSDDIDEAELLAGGSKGLEKLSHHTKGMMREKEIKSPPQEIKAFREEYSELLKEIKRPLVVYIDNLDRCTPLNAIHTLEAIRLFLFLPNTAFVIAADEEMIRTAVREYHKGATDRHQTDYLDKLIQVPIKVPKPGALEVRAYLFMLLAQDLGVDEKNLEVLQDSLSNSLRNAWKEKPIQVNDLILQTNNLDENIKVKLREVLNVAERITPLLAGSSQINGNPRIVKRLLNVIKMRKQISDRREMNLEESLITKLVIFERCAGKDATIELYRQIDSGQGFAQVFKELESDTDNAELPESWLKIETFVREWALLPPLLKDVDLRAAAYLSRETLPMGAISRTLSVSAKELIELIMTTKTRNSPALIGKINNTPKEDYLSVMEEVISALRTISDWSTKPAGIDGALVLSKNDIECKDSLLSYLKGIKTQRWLSKMIKELGS